MPIRLEETALVLLAAGLSRRHPSGDKLQRPLGGLPLALHAAGMLQHLTVQGRYAVTGSTQTDLADALTACGWSCVMNPSPEQGQGASIALGCGAALEKDQPGAVLICLADMPFVTRGHIHALADRIDPTGGITAVVSSDGTRTSPPALFAQDHFQALLALDGDAGARSIIKNAGSAVAVVAAPAGSLRDFDLPEDFDAAEAAKHPAG